MKMVSAARRGVRLPRRQSRGVAFRRRRPMPSHKMPTRSPVLEPGPKLLGGLGREQKEPTHRSDDSYAGAESSRRGRRGKQTIDLLPRRHVGRRRPQDRVELRLGRGQVIQVRVPKRF